MQVIHHYSRSYISGIRKKFISSKKIVSIYPFGSSHKLLLNSTKKDVKPLEIILDDSELSDLTRCLDLVRFDPRLNLRWDINLDRPFSRKYINSNLIKSNKNLNFFYSVIIFICTSTFLIIIPTNDRFELRDTNDISKIISDVN